MSPGSAPATVALLTEDSSSAAMETLRALATKILVLVDPDCQTQQIDFEPATDEAAAAMRANRWKSRAPADHAAIVSLRQALATKLVRGHLVLLHVDGDRPWAAREHSENAARFRELILDKVRMILMQRPDHAAKSAEYMGLLQPVCPYYSVEAWLYQNTVEARRLCRKHYNGRDEKTFVKWQRDPTVIDEVEGPKDRVCLGSKYNSELARVRFPVAKAYAVGKSFAACVDALRASAQVIAVLTRTHAGQ